MTTPRFNALVEALRILPGVGPRSAQRMAFHLLERDRDGARSLAESLSEAADKVGFCERCRTLSETPLCRICSDPARDETLLCVVESPADQFAIESAGGYRGRYFVLGGRLSPIDGIGPEEIGVSALLALAGSESISEVILATNATVEGEATAHYIADAMRAAGITTSRIAHGVPVGGELEFVDGGTLAHAFAGRTRVD